MSAHNDTHTSDDPVENVVKHIPVVIPAAGAVLIFLLAFIAVSIVHATFAITGHETLISFVILQAMGMFCFGLLSGNFGAMAMEPLGHVAGAAASAQGFISMVGGALIGFGIGQQFDGTLVPITLGYTACGLTGLTIVLIAERGRLFRGRGGESDSLSPAAH